MPPELEIFPSPPSHFRMRAEFKIWHENNHASYAMFEPGKYKKSVVIDDFSIGHKRIVELMSPLLDTINASEVLRQKLFQIEFLTTTTNDAVVTLIYHKPLNDTWLAEAAALETQLSCSIIGRSKKQKQVLSKDYVNELFCINGSEYRYKQVESGFTQPNGFVCQHMLEWAQTVTQGLGGDLLELYCGNGNFTLPFSLNFKKILATEVSKISVKSARENIAENAIENIIVLRMSSEEITQALESVREFRRLRDINLEDYNFSTVFVDPPRAGLDDATLKLVSRFDNILYVSCNPETLKNNLETLISSHQIDRFALFDQFPYTEHRECGVLLRKKK